MRSEQDGLPTPQRYWAMLAIAIGITMAVLDGAIANIALPTITHRIHAAPSAAVWIVNAYQLINVVLLLPLASLGERVGYRRIYVVGLAVFTAGSFACALSQGLPALIASRVAQGVGAAGIMSVNGALVRHIFPLALLGRGVGVNALVVSLAAAVAPTTAAAILAVASWQWLFAINVPFGLVNLLLASVVLPSSARSAHRFDTVSALLNAITFGLLFTGIDIAAHGGSELVIGLAALLVAAGAGTVLLARARRAPSPLIPLDLLGIRLFRLSVITSIFSFAAYAITFLALPFLLETALHRSAVQTGLIMTAWPAAVGVTAPVAGRLADRMPAAFLGSVGLLVLALGLIALATMPTDTPIAGIVCRMAMGGLGFGLFQAPNNRTLLAAAPRARAGAAGGMLAMARLLGTTTGATIVALVFRAAPGRAETTDVWIATGFALAGAVISGARLATPRASRRSHAARGAPDPAGISDPEPAKTKGVWS